MQETAFHWISQHGYVGIFSLLVFGIIGLPVPDEWLLTFSGYLIEARAPDGWRWRSSLTREDTGAGACELVWVEQIAAN